MPCIILCVRVTASLQELIQFYDAKVPLTNLSSSSQSGNEGWSLELEMVTTGLSFTKASVC